MLDDIRDHMYHPKRNWTVLVREHLNRSSGVDGLIKESLESKRTSFLSHPLPECSCRTPESTAGISEPVKGSNGKLLYGGEDECPEWMQRGLATVSSRKISLQEESVDESELREDDMDLEQPESDDGGNKVDASRPSDQDEEMDPDD